MSITKTKSWRDKTCENCVYRKNTECRINPPTAKYHGYQYYSIYPVVFVPAHTSRAYLMDPIDKPDFYMEACAKYKEIK